MGQNGEQMVVVIKRRSARFARHARVKPALMKPGTTSRAGTSASLEDDVGWGYGHAVGLNSSFLGTDGTCWSRQTRKGRGVSGLKENALLSEQLIICSS